MNNTKQAVAVFGGFALVAGVVAWKVVQTTRKHRAQAPPGTGSPASGGNGKKGAQTPATTPLNAPILGFDLDHTLCRYHLRPLVHLVYESLRQKVVEDHPEWAAKIDPNYDESWVVKGSVCDWETGDVLVVAADGSILIARHGKHSTLSRPALLQKHGATYKHMPIVLAGSRSMNLFTSLTYFDMPCVYLVAQMVDICDELSLPYTTVRDNVFKAFNHNFNPDAFAEGRGKFFPAIRADPSTYIAPRPVLRRWLENKRKHHTLFLLTNSHADFTNLLCSQCLGPDWQSLFHLVGVHALKPSFFSLSRPFYALDVDTCSEGRMVGAEGGEECVRAGKGGVYCQGNVGEWERALLRFHYKSDDPEVWGPCTRIAYFGDHLTGDVRAVANCGALAPASPSCQASPSLSVTWWEAVAVVEERRTPAVAPSALGSPELVLECAPWPRFADTVWGQTLSRWAALVVADVEDCEALEQ